MTRSRDINIARRTGKHAYRAGKAIAPAPFRSKAMVRAFESAWIDTLIDASIASLRATTAGEPHIRG